MIYKSEFPVLYFTTIRKITGEYHNTDYNWQIYGLRFNMWPDIMTTDSAIRERTYGDGDNGCPSIHSPIECINARSAFNNYSYFILKDGKDYVFIRLNPGKWYAMQRSAFNVLFRYTGKTMDELPVFVSYAEPMSSDNEYTVMRPIYDTRNSITLETDHARILYPTHADKNCVCKRSIFHFRMPEWIQKYTFTLFDDINFIDLCDINFIDLCSKAMFIKGKFGIFSRDDTLVFIGMKGSKPIIYVCKDIGNDSLCNKDRVIKEPDPVVILSPEECVNLDKKQIPTIVNVAEDLDKGFFNDYDASSMDINE